MTNASQHLEPVPPGEILLEEFMKPYGISQNQLARDIDVPPNRINEIIKGKRAISVDTALRLAQYFSTSPELWTGLQLDYEMRIAKRDLLPHIKTRVRPKSMTDLGQVS